MKHLFLTFSLFLVFFWSGESIIFGCGNTSNQIENGNEIQTILKSQLTYNMERSYTDRFETEIGERPEFLSINEILFDYYGNAKVRVKEEENIVLSQGRYRFTVKTKSVEVELFLKHRKCYWLEWILNRDD